MCIVPNAESLSLKKFQANFGTEENCASYILSKRWKEGYCCPKCKHRGYYEVKTRMLLECKQCSYQISVTAGTIMHKSKLPLTTWFWAIYLVAHDKRGKSALSLSQILDLNYRTALRLMRKIRKAMRLRDDNYLLSGIVEMDDAYFGAPRKGKDGRGTNKAKAVIALSKTPKNRPAYLRIKVIDQVTIEEINRVAKECVKPGSKIVSDGHSSYKKLTGHKEYKDKFLKMLHNVIGNAKAFIQGSYHGLGPEYLQSYFDEFCFRFNRRFKPNEIFDRLLTTCVMAEPFPVLK